MHTYFMLFMSYSVWMLLLKILKHLVKPLYVRYNRSVLKSFIVLFRSKCLKCLINKMHLFFKTSLLIVYHKYQYTKIIWTFTSVRMCLSRYVDAEKKRQPLNTNSVYLFRLISTCRQLRWVFNRIKALYMTQNLYSV